MCFDTLRVYESGRLYDVALPDWYKEADRLSREGNVSWHHAFTRVLGCYCVPLTDDGCQGGWVEVRFWPSEKVGNFVLIDTEAGIIEQILIPNPVDWLPFLTQHLTPLISAAAQAASAERQRKLTQAFIAWARHGEGSHVDRDTGLSRIDLDNDHDRRRAQQARAVMERERREGRA
ncbi:hypothetical protein [Pontitalea aquivivens]|uniref:hypothetical protein n=1 Tax=Pontitalea aquivivens TaxID=3388663 RepID=UPI003970B8AC